MPVPDPAGEHRVALALRDALPTRRHADHLFDAAAEALGPRARVEAAPDGNHRVLFLLDGEDPRCVVPWPILTLYRRPRQILPLEFPGLKPAPPLPPRPGKAPRLRDLGPGSITLHDGVRYVEVAYAADGRWFETSRGGPPSTLEGVLPVLAAGGGAAAERIATFVAGQAHDRRGPLRVVLPDPRAWNAWAAWKGGLRFLRAALARGAFPEAARWIAADPVDGTALGWGATRDEALFAWRAEVDRVRPGSAVPERPSFEPPAPPELPGRPGHLHLRIEIGGAGNDPLHPAPPPPDPATIPAAILELADPPAAPCPLGAWKRFLGGCGETVAAGVRGEPGGWTAVGAAPLSVLGAPDAEAALDEAERAWNARYGGGGGPAAEHPWTARLFRLLDVETGRPVPPSTNEALHAKSPALLALDGDLFAIGAARMRRTGT